MQTCSEPGEVSYIAAFQHSAQEMLTKDKMQSLASEKASPAHAGRTLLLILQEAFTLLAHGYVRKVEDTAAPSSEQAAGMCCLTSDDDEKVEVFECHLDVHRVEVRSL
ncbi:hypothetical protein MMC14_009749 [Varicellaria rhodocarpa]|nr:hypothetical protein [Varicellaria rhodocarpa]